SNILQMGIYIFSKARNIACGNPAAEYKILPTERQVLSVGKACFFKSSIETYVYPTDECFLTFDKP
ncbi:MAG: hypothetical protein AAGD28_22995, partial [Bacteroidota bacterium]